jgi:hypothetical protein
MSTLRKYAVEISGALTGAVLAVALGFFILVSMGVFDAN